jgi:S1-C subfamily serine protease
VSRRIAPLLAVLALLAGLLVAGCSSDDEGGSDSKERTSAASSEADAPDPSADRGSSGRFNARQIYSDASSGVVTVISVLGGEDRNPLGGGAGGQGSGFVINEEGEIVTNAHVVTDAQGAGGDGEISAAEDVFVEFADRNSVPAEIVGFDPNADIALLRIDPDGLDLKPLEFGDSEEVEIGTPVAAIGSPFGQDQSLSTGIVSATERSIESLTDFRIEGALQTDASINPGNSGGPLIDPSGRVIGVNQQINTTSGGNEGVGFAVPANLVVRSIEDLREDGEAEYAFIGVTSVSLYPQLAERLDIDAPNGSLVLEVTSGSPADDAGLRGSGDEKIEFQGREIEIGGDVIVAVDGTELEGETDLSRLITNRRPGETVELEIIRGGERRTVDVELRPRPNRLS